MGFGAFAGEAFGQALGQGAGMLMQKRMFDKQHQFSTHQFNKMYALQERAYSHGIQDKVADAKRAGIHPLAALGAQTYNPSPVSVGQGMAPDMGGSMADIGQNIGRALTANKSSHQRQIMDIQLSNAKIDNEMKQIELNNARRSMAGQVGPGVPDLVQNKAVEVRSHAAGKPNLEAGSVTSTGFARTGSGLMPVPSADVKEKIEDQFIPEMVWAGKNYIGPILGNQKNKPPKKLLPKGYKDWQWSVRSFEWKPVKGKGRSPWQRIKGAAKKFFKKNKFNHKYGH
jgi:hypothetical protein